MHELKYVFGSVSVSFSMCACGLPQTSTSAGTEPTSVATIRSARTPEGATTAPVRAATGLKEWDVLASVRSLFCGPHHVAASHGLNAFSHLGTKDFMFHFQMNSVEPLFTACEAVKRHFFFVLLLSHASHQLVCLFCPAAFTLCVL